MKNSVDMILCPSWVIPIESPSQVLAHDQVLENHAVVIDKGRIVAVLPTDLAQENYVSDNTVCLMDQVVMPGLINSHTHSPMTLFRGMADDLPLMDWLNNYIWPAEQRWMNEAFMQDGTELGLLEMIRSGTTCFNENYFYSNVTAEVALKAHMRAIIGAEIMNLPTQYASNMDECLSKMEIFCETWRDHPLIKPTIHPQGPYTVDDETFLKVKAFGDKHQLVTHIHLHETLAEIEMSLQQYQKRPIRRLYDLGLLSKRLVCIHMCQLNEEDMALLQETHPSVVHCPEANLKLASGFCPVQTLMNSGINVALGTDGPASNNDLDMFGEIHTAALLAKGVNQDPTALRAFDALKLATINGAKAFGLDQEIGSIENGKSADLIAVDLSAINSQPIYNPISQLVYATNSRQVTHVWVAGKCLFKNGEFTTLDEEAILAKAKMWRRKIRP